MHHLIQPDGCCRRFLFYLIIRLELPVLRLPLYAAAASLS